MQHRHYNATIHLDENPSYPTSVPPRVGDHVEPGPGDVRILRAVSGILRGPKSKGSPRYVLAFLDRPGTGDADLVSAFYSVRTWEIVS